MQHNCNSVLEYFVFAYWKSEPVHHWPCYYWDLRVYLKGLGRPESRTPRRLVQLSVSVPRTNLYPCIIFVLWEPLAFEITRIYLIFSKIAIDPSPKFISKIHKIIKSKNKWHVLSHGIPNFCGIELPSPNMGFNGDEAPASVSGSKTIFKTHLSSSRIYSNSFCVRIEL